MNKTEAHSYLLGLYLGDGYIDNTVPKYGVYRLRIYQSTKHQARIEEHKTALAILLPKNKVFLVSKQGCVEVCVYSKSLSDLFPHGKGKKHDREIKLSQSQQDVISTYPIAFVRGLLQSDGSRYVTKQGYIVYSFTNMSEDIIKLYMRGLDTLGVSYTANKRISGTNKINVVLVQRQADSQKLDQLMSYI